MRWRRGASRALSGAQRCALCNSTSHAGATPCGRMEVVALGASVPCQSRSGARFATAASALGAASAFSFVDRALRMVRPNLRSVDSAPFFLALPSIDFECQKHVGPCSGQKSSNSSYKLSMSHHFSHSPKILLQPELMVCITGQVQTMLTWCLAPGTAAARRSRR